MSHVTQRRIAQSMETIWGFCHQTLLVLTVIDMEDIQYQYLLNLTGTALSPLSTEDI